MPLLTLKPLGEERSTIKHHFRGLFFFGMTPIGLVCIPGGLTWRGYFYILFKATSLYK